MVKESKNKKFCDDFLKDMKNVKKYILKKLT